MPNTLAFDTKKKACFVVIKKDVTQSIWSNQVYLSLETTGSQSGMLTPRSTALNHPSMVLKEDSMIKVWYTAPVYYCFWDKYWTLCFSIYFWPRFSLRGNILWPFPREKSEKAKRTWYAKFQVRGIVVHQGTSNISILSLGKLHSLLQSCSVEMAELWVA